LKTSASSTSVRSRSAWAPVSRSEASLIEFARVAFPPSRPWLNRAPGRFAARRFFCREMPRRSAVAEPRTSRSCSMDFRPAIRGRRSRVPGTRIRRDWRRTRAAPCLLRTLSGIGHLLLRRGDARRRAVHRAGEGRTTRKNHPDAGVSVQRCFMELSGLPPAYVGGKLTTNTIGSRNALGDRTDPPGYTQPSIATIRLWKRR